MHLAACSCADLQILLTQNLLFLSNCLPYGGPHECNRSFSTDLPDPGFAVDCPQPGPQDPSRNGTWLMASSGLSIPGTDADCISAKSHRHNC